ncbi:pectin lyase-like protein [Wilcoxina mikolae CBS 423.85]|nr:pectin lyase-like protein [Wilcoxina mikolae CBS 423.85]
MKLSLFSVVALAASALAAPAAVLTKRAAPEDACPMGYATMNGGTTGGAGGTTVTVNTLAELKAAAGAKGPAIIILASSITDNGMVEVASDKTILAKDNTVVMTGVGFWIVGVKNVIVRNLSCKKVLAPGDCFTIMRSTNIWLDHVDVSSDQDHGKDYYDGLIDITHASDFVTISNSHIHDHFKASLIGHSDQNGPEDTGYLHVTFAHNHFENLNSRGPSLRFGTVHLYNNVYDNCPDGINARDGAQVLVENNTWNNTKKPLYSIDNTGKAVANGNDFGNGHNEAPLGTLTSVPYTYTLGTLQKTPSGDCGATLNF